MRLRAAALLAALACVLLAACVGDTPATPSLSSPTPGVRPSFGGSSASQASGSPAVPAPARSEPAATQPPASVESPVWTPDPPSIAHADATLEAAFPELVLGKPVLVASFTAAEFLPKLQGDIQFMAYPERFAVLLDRLHADPTRVTVAWGGVAVPDEQHATVFVALRVRSAAANALATEWLSISRPYPAHPRTDRLGDKAITWLGWQTDSECIHASGDVLYVLYLSRTVDPATVDPPFAAVLAQLP